MHISMQTSEELFDALCAWCAREGIRVEETEGTCRLGYTGLAFIEERRVLIGRKEKGKTYSRLFTLAHEVGHILDRSTMSSGDGEAFLEGLSPKRKRRVLREERRAWKRGKKLLRKLGFREMSLFNSTRARDLNCYKAKLYPQKVELSFISKGKGEGEYVERS